MYTPIKVRHIVWILYIVLKINGNLYVNNKFILNKKQHRFNNDSNKFPALLIEKIPWQNSTRGLKVSYVNLNLLLR